MVASPMFPLGSVLFPYALMPLHVFEPRYRQLVDTCLAGDGTFGVVLIERGSEVGGGDVRFDVGTRTRIHRAEQLDDGRWVLITVGTERVRVHQWLPDDPFPRAEIEQVDDTVAAPDAAPIDEVTQRLQRVLALRTQLGEIGAAPVDLAVALDPDPVRASFEACAMANLGPLDGQRLLELDDAGERLARLATLLEEEAAVLEFRLSPG
jgi:Lon protease-like protein